VLARSGIQGSQPRAPALCRRESLYWVPELTFVSGELRVGVGHKPSVATGSLPASHLAMHGQSVTKL